MKALDTNIIIRFITKDDEQQSRIAAGYLIEEVFISHSVLIETEWVLRAAFEWNRTRVNGALRALLRIGTVSVERPEMLAWALDQHERGADWADMLHLIAARHHQAFVTFDQGLARRVGRDAPVEVELLK